VTQLPSDFSVVAITRLDDEWLCPWLDLYETTFPPEERNLISFFLHTLKESNPGHFMLAGLYEQTLAALAYYVLIPEQRLAWFWYLAIAPALRGHGLGTAMYRTVLASLPADTRAMLLEVERPDLAETPAQREIRERRIGLYHRLGARTLGGIHYLQSVGPHQPSIPMHVMIHPLAPLDAATAFTLAYTVFGDAITQTGPLMLE
jgi:ribosomal protein S18 acetylase RimI-like enzyme